MGRRPTHTPEQAFLALLFSDDDHQSEVVRDAWWLERIRTAKPGSPFYRGARDPLTGAPIMNATRKQQRVHIGAPKDGRNQTNYGTRRRLDAAG